VGHAVRKTYLAVLFTKASVEVFEKGLENARAHLEDVKKKLDQDVGTRFDVIRGEVKVANAKAQLIQARNNLSTARAGLLRLMGLPQDTKLSLTGKLAYRPAKVSVPRSLEKAYKSRIDLKAAEVFIDIQDRQIDIAVGGQLPKAYAFFNYGWEKPSTKSFGGTEGDDYWNAGMIIDVPLFDGFQGLGKIRKGYGSLRQARWAYEDLRQQIALEVKQAATAMRNAVEFLESQKENVRQAEEGLRLVKIGFGLGTNTQLDVLDVQTALTAARLNYLQAVFNYQSARFDLENAEASSPARLAYQK
jgi:outer membrane protein TolC